MRIDAIVHGLGVSLVVILAPCVAAAAVSIDAVGPGPAGSSCTNCAALAWSHNVSTADPNRILTVAVAVGSSPDSRTVAVSYGGVPMTSAGKVHSNNQTAGFVQLFYLKAPASGAHSVQVTLTGGTVNAIEAGSVSFAGVDQTTAVRNIKTAAGASATPAVTVTSAPGDLVVAALVNGSSITSSGQTLNWLRNVNGSTAGGNGAQSTAAGAASVSMTYATTNDWWGIVAMDIVAASAGPAPPAIPSFVASPQSIVQGGTSTLSWTVTGNPAPATSLDNGIGTVSGSSVAVTPAGTTTYTLTATNASGSATATATVTVSAADTTAPKVSMTGPASGAIVSGSAVAVSATASDNIGVAGVQFLLDGTSLGAEDATAPYSVTWNTTSAAPGAHVLSARARDAAGNVAIAASITAIVDNQGPVGSVVINGGAAATNSRNATLTLSASDANVAVTQMRFSNTGTSYSTAETYATTKAWTLTTGSGTKTVYVQYKDALGNWSGAFTDTIVVDTTAPTISSIASSNVTNTSATITWTTSEPATSQLEYGTTTSYGSLTAIDTALVTTHQVTVTGLKAQTLYNYRVRSKDAAGNESLSTNRTLTTLAGPVDTTPPSIPSAPTATPVSDSRIDLSWTASTDDVAVTGYKVLRGGVQIATTSGTSYVNTGLSPSTTYIYRVAAFDAAGNVSAPSDPSNGTTSADTVLPVTAVSSPSSGAIVFGVVTLSAAASDDVQIAGVTFQVDGFAVGSEDTVAPYSTTLDTTALSDGDHVLTTIARDTSGNYASSSPVMVTVNNTAPPTGTPTLVQHLHTGTNATNEPGNNFRFTLPNAVLADNCLIIALTYQYSVTRTIQITDNFGTNTYLAGPSVTNGAMTTRVFYASGVAAGTQTLTVTFDGPVYNFQVDISEFYHVATTAAYDGGAASSAAASPSVTAGSVTTSSDGDLVYQYAVDVTANVIGFNHSVTSITPATGFTLLAMDPYGIAAQYQVQQASGPVTPTLNVAISGAIDPYNTVALALKPSSAGTAPPPGIRIVHATHIHTASTTQSLSVPSVGNLIVLSTTYPTSQGYSINSVSDSRGNGYTRLTPSPWAGQMVYTPTAAATGPDFRITINGSLAIPYVIYDIVGAAPVAFDNYAVAIRGQTAPQSDITDAPIITPSTANGLVLTSFPVGTGPVSGTIGGGFIFDSVFYTGQTDCSACMDSADGYAHVYNIDTSTLHFDWHVTNDGTVTDGGALAVAFRSQGS